jgi:ELWxxDGT repeat protein
VAALDLLVDAGRVFVIHGTGAQRPAPSSFDVLTNRTITGSGDYVVDRATGQPATFERTINPNEESWLRFTTLGDGLPGNYIAVTPFATEPYSLRGNAEKSYYTYTGDTVDGTTAGSLLVYGRNESIGVPASVGLLEYDLSSVLRLREDALVKAKLQLDYSAYTFNLPVNFANIEANKHAVLGNTLFFRTSEINHLMRSDGTAAGTVRVNVAGTLIENPENFLKVGSHLYFTANDNLWRIDSEVAVPTILANGVTSLSEVVEIGNQVFYTSSGRLYSLAPNTTPSEIVFPSATFAAQQLTHFNLGVSADQPNLFVVNSGVTGQSLYRYEIATQTLSVAKTEVNGAVLTTTGGPSGTALYFSSNALVPPESGQLWQVARSGSGIAINRVMVGATPSSGFSSLIDVGGTLFTKQGFKLFTVANGGTTASLLKDFNPTNANPAIPISQFTKFDFGAGPRLAFTAAENAGRYDVNNGEVWVSDGTLAGTHRMSGVRGASRLLAVGNRLYFTGFQGVQSSNQELFRTNGTPAGTVLAHEFQLGSTGGFESSTSFIAGDTSRVFAVAISDMVPRLYSGNESIPFRDLDHNLGVTLKVETLFDEGNGLSSHGELLGQSRFTFTTTINDPTGLAEIELNSIAGDAVREALRTGKTRLTVRMSTSSPNVQTYIQPSLGELTPGNAPNTAGPGNTRLVVTPSAGALFDLFTEDGDTITSGKAVFDMRNLNAGTYFIRAYSPQPINTPLPITLTIAAPPTGQTRLQYEDPDRDIVRGGDGNDTLAGNGDIDRMLGGTGKDLFVTDFYNSRTVGIFGGSDIVLAGPEVRDFNSVEDYPLGKVTTSDAIESFKAAQLDPEVPINDLRLRRALADAIGIPITTAAIPAQDPLLSRPIHASDLASLIELDLGNLPINGIAGLEYATSLKYLNLSSTFVYVFAPLAATTSTQAISAGAPLGTAHLEYFAADHTAIYNTTPLEQLNRLKGLSLDYTYVGPYLSALANLGELEMLSLDSSVVNSAALLPLANLQSLSLTNNQISDLSALTYLDRLKHLYLNGNDVTAVDLLTGNWFADNTPSGDATHSSPQASFASSGNWQANHQSTSAAFGGDYLFHEPSGDSSASIWTFTDLPKGDYEIWVSWPEHDNRASNAWFETTVTDQIGAGSVQSTSAAIVNQRLAPSGSNLGGVKWQKIDTVSLLVTPIVNNLQPTSIAVALRDIAGANAANGILAADAVRLVRVNHRAPLELLTLADNPLDNLSHAVIEGSLISTIENSTTPWKELTYTDNQAPTVTVQPNRLLQSGSAYSPLLFNSNTLLYTISDDTPGAYVTVDSTSATPVNVNTASRQFSGDDVVVFPNELINGLHDSFGVETWFSTTQGGTIVSSVSASSEDQFAIYISGSLVSVYNAFGFGDVNTGINLVDGAAHHIYVEFDTVGGTISVYVDGVLRGTRAMYFPGPISSAGFVLGQKQFAVLGNYSDGFVGNLDEFRLWTGSRTAQQILADRNVRVPNNEPGLRAYYTLDDATASTTAKNNLFDLRPSDIVTRLRGEGNPNDLASSNTATLHGGAGYGPGVETQTQAFAFDGEDDYLQLTNAPPLVTTAGISIEAWIHPTATPTYGFVVGQRSGPQLFIGTGNQVYFYLYGTGFLQTTSSIPLNQWTHIAGTYAPGGSMTIYVNGIAAASTPVLIAPFTVTSFPWQIGGFNEGTTSDYYFPGRIDELGIYNRGLTADEIRIISGSRSATFGDSVGGAGNIAQIPPTSTPVTDMLGPGILLDGLNARPIGGFAGLAKVYYTAHDVEGRTATAVQDIYVGPFSGIYGTKFEDFDGNGLRGVGEPGIEGWRIYLDVNGDSIADQSTLTDRNGDYAFANLPWSITTHQVWAETRSAWTATTTTPANVIVINTTLPNRADHGSRHLVSIELVDSLQNEQPLPRDEGSSVPLLAVVAPNITVSQYQWSVVGIDGVPVTSNNFNNAAIASFVPGNQGDYLVTLTVTPTTGTPITETRRVIVRNLAPKLISATAPSSWNEGDDLAIHLTATDVDPLTVEVEFDTNGDGLFNGANDLHLAYAAGSSIPWSTIVANGIADGTNSRLVRVNVRDDLNAKGNPVEFTLTLNNTAPTVASANYNIVEGDSLTLLATASDPAGVLDPLVYGWDLDNDGSFDDATGSNPTVTWAQLVALGLNNGQVVHPISVRVNDGDGGITTASASITIANRAPTVASLGSTITVDEGTPVVLAGAFTDPSATDTHTFAWTITKNGAAHATATTQLLTFTPDDQGAYIATLVVTDSDGASDLQSITINATNVAPRATIGLPTPAFEGVNAIQFTSLLDGAADLTAGLRFSVDVNNDGSFEVIDSSSGSVNITLPDQGQYELLTRVKDKDGATRDYVRTIVASNVAPTATFGLSTTGAVNEGATGVSIQFTSVTDPSSVDTTAGFTYSYDLDGDGGFELDGLTSSSRSIIFPNDGSRIIRGRITDRDGESTTYSLPIAVQNVAPSITSFSAAATGDEGSTITFTGTLADPGSDVLSARGIVRRSSVPGDVGVEFPVIINADKTFQFDYVFGTDVAGGYDLILMVTDGTATTQQTRQITIDNVAPAMLPQGNATIATGRHFTRKISFVDPGQETWTVTADYGLGFVPVAHNASTKSFELDHVFTTPGTYPVQIKIFDGIDTSTSSFSVQVVANVAPTVAKQIPDAAVLQGFNFSRRYAELTSVFADSDGPETELTYTVASNTNAALVTPTITNGMLYLDLNTALSGAASITIRATDAAGLMVEDTFNVSVLALDATAPTSSAITNSPKATSKEILVSVAGGDVAGAAGAQVSGILEYDLYVAIDNGAFVKFATVPASVPSALFYATSGHTYYFRSVGRDVEGNTELDLGGNADTVVQVGDLDAAATQVQSASAKISGLFNVEMTGSDSGGSGLRFFDLYVALDDGPANFIASVEAGAANGQGIYSGSTTYQGVTDGAPNSYRFFSLGRDGSGNVESAPGHASDVVVTQTFANVGLQATGIDVQLGATQRSYIRYVDVLFNSETDLSSLLTLGRVKVERFALNATIVTPETGLAANSFAVTKVADRLRLDFGTNGITGSRTSNAGDGLYRVLLDVNGDGDFVDAVDAMFEFSRIVGDANGDARVNAADLSIVNSQFGSSGTNLSGDIDGSGSVNLTDRNITTAQSNNNRQLDAALLAYLDD